MKNYTDLVEPVLALPKLIAQTNPEVVADCVYTAHNNQIYVESTFRITAAEHTSNVDITFTRRQGDIIAHVTASGMHFCTNTIEHLQLLARYLVTCYTKPRLNIYELHLSQLTKYQQTMILEFISKFSHTSDIRIIK